MSIGETFIAVILAAVKGTVIVTAGFAISVAVCWGIKIAVCKIVKKVRRKRNDMRRNYKGFGVNS